MSDGTGTEPTTQQDPAVEGGGNPLATKPIADMADEEKWEYWRAAARKHEDQNKNLMEKASKYDQLVESQKSDVQKLEDRATTAESGQAKAEAEATRLRVAIANGITDPELIDRLRGTTEEELTADAKKLTELFTGAGSDGRPATPDLRRAAGGGAPPAHPQDGNAALRDAIARRRG